LYTHRVGNLIDLIFEHFYFSLRHNFKLTRTDVDDGVRPSSDTSESRTKTKDGRITINCAAPATPNCTSSTALLLFIMDDDDDDHGHEYRQDEGESTEGEDEESKEEVVRKLLEQAKSLSSHLKHSQATADVIRDLPSELRTLLRGDPLGLACWNALSDVTKGLLLGTETAILAKTVMLKDNLEIIRLRRTSVRKSIQADLNSIILHAPQDTLFLLRLFLDLRDKKKKSRGPPGQKSMDALSNRSEVSGTLVGNKLTGEMVHYNMFSSSGFHEQIFPRFEFPLAIDTLLPPCEHGQIIPPGHQDSIVWWKTIQDYLAIANPRAKEPLTQALFSLFMENMLKKFNIEKGNDDKLAIVPVTGMHPIDVEVTVSETYMRENKRIRELANKATTPGYQGGDWETQLSIMSDLVVVPLSATISPGQGSKAQRQRFIQCRINVEMKRFRYLMGHENKNPLTQLSAESYARKSELEDPKVLYSVLTDCCGFYALCHVVTPERQPDEYWISRQESDPKRIVAILYWLLLQSSPNTEVSALLRRLENWRVDTAQDKPVSNENDHGTPSQEEGNTARGVDTASAAPPVKRARQGEEERSVRLTMDDLFNGDDDDDESEGVDWDHFYALQSQRQAGKAFQFNLEFLRP
jgi:hypothetical protein